MYNRDSSSRRYNERFSGGSRHGHSERESERQRMRDQERYERMQRETHTQDKIHDDNNKAAGVTSVPTSANASEPQGSQAGSQPVQKDSQKENGASDTMDAKKLERLKKLEAWKKKQEAKKKEKEKEKAMSVPEPKPVVKVPQVKVAPAKKLFSLKAASKAQVKKKNLFGDFEDEDTQTKKKFFKPVSGISADSEETGEQPQEQADEEEDIDTLDAFMKNIERQESGDVHMKDTDDVLMIDEDGNEYISNDKSANLDADEAKQLLKKLKNNKKTKILESTAYDLKNLEPFPKDFSIKTDLSKLDADEVLNFRVLNSIFISNKKINPVFNFYHFGLDSEILGTIINDFKYENPTPIQSQTVPAIMSGNDVIGIGRTGSGKTMCYLLGMLKHIKQQRPLLNGETGPMSIILSPTRELATQIFQTLEKFLKNTKLKAFCCTGGSEIHKQINELKKGVEIIVATPGRYIDLLTINGGKLMKTSRITFVILDEADRLFDLGFEPQINQIMKTIRPDKQCVLFSATFPNKLQQFAVKILRKPITITVGNKQVVNENIKQLAEIFETEELKFNYLLQLLGKQGDQKTIIFCESQIQVNLLNKKLTDKGYTPVAIHAGLPSYERNSNLQDFRQDKNILICTEVLSRGLDVPDVNLVILFNGAKTFAQYIHTTGRTARGNTKGTAISLLSKNEELQAYIVFKCMKEEEIPEKIRAIGEKFDKELKDGKKKISSGFGGKGLDNLDKLREENEQTERKKYGEEGKKKNADSENEDDDAEGAEDDIGANMDIVFNSTEDGKAPDSGAYTARINVNDLPQAVRWVATNNSTLVKIIDETSASVTYKGKYYPEGKEPKEGEEPKLYLLVEAEKKSQLMDAIDLFKKVILQGLKKANVQQQERSGKFTI